MAIYIALVHYPVLDKQKRAVTTSITNLDIHDLARVACTYNIKRFYIVNPLPTQQWFANRVIQHWLEGYGAEYNPTRQEAMRLAKVAADLEEVAEDIFQNSEFRSQKSELYFVATTARTLPNQISYAEMRQKIKEATADYCIVFGTGWGLHPLLLLDMDYILEPIKGLADYNHLSVRSAAGIILDRLLSPAASRPTNQSGLYI